MLGRFLVNRWVHFLILFCLLLAALWFGQADTNFRKDLRFIAFDNLNKAYPRQADEENRVIIIDIDDDSLKEIGQWPWPRTVLADIVTNLTALGAKVIAFDGVLAEPDRSSPARLAENLPETDNMEELRESLNMLEDHDSIFARAIKESGIFVSAFTFSSYSQIPASPRVSRPLLAKKDVKKNFLQNARPFEKAATFIPELEKAAAGNGSFMASPDHDGVLRSTGMIFTDGKQIYPSLSLEALRVALGGRKDHVKIGETPVDQRGMIDTDYRIVVGARVIPVDRDGLLWVHYRGFDRSKDYVSAHKALNPEYHNEIRDQINGHVVLIGASAEGLKDLRNSPIQAFIPGVEIHANVTEQVLQDDYLLRPPIAEIFEFLFILLVGLFMIMLAPMVNVMVMASLCAGLITIIIFGSIHAYTQYGVLIDSVYPAISVFFIFVASIMLTYLRTEAERRQVRDAFGLYISPDFMKELTSDPDKLKLGGEIKPLTVMFTDIRSFTTISEGLTPEELIQLMNDFLTPMSDLVMQNRGTIDKYMGDAMMAFWNAPLDDRNHERHACITALQMNAALVPINERVKKKSEEIGKEPVLLNAGIGINTGPCAVGNMGSKQRFAYSTLGDAVNLASRLEGQTKNYGINILIGHETYMAVPDFAALEFDLIQVKGKTEPVHIYALLGDDKMAETKSYQTLKKNHDEMITAYRAQKFKKAIELCEANNALEEWHLDVFYNLYIERAKDLIKNPPPKEWDGVFVATSK